MLDISRMSMHATTKLWLGWRHFSRTVAYEIKLDIVLRELIIQRVGHLCHSDYEVFHHRPVALKHGATEDMCDAMRTGDFSIFMPEWRAALTFATEIIRDANPSDAALAEMRTYFTDEDVFNIIMLIGAYMTTARIVATAGIGPETSHSQQD
ncbi:MAG: carboxymuconolactone decarboxylase family protein [Alphaproteobacteria bacterium]